MKEMQAISDRNHRNIFIQSKIDGTGRVRAMSVRGESDKNEIIAYVGIHVSSMSIGTLKLHCSSF